MAGIDHIVFKTGDARHWTPRQLLEYVLVEMNREDSKFASHSKAILILGHEDKGERLIKYDRFFAGVSRQEGLGILFQNGILEATER
jgi:hypothetical protein